MSTVPVTIKWVQADPWVIGTVRLSIAVSLLFFLLPNARRIIALPKRDWGILGVLGLFFAVHWVTYFFSIKLGTATMAVVATISFYGIFTSIFGAIFLGHHFRYEHALGLVICTVGTFMTAGQFEVNSDAFFGFLMGIVSGLSFAMLPVVHQRSRHLESSMRSFMQFLGALALFVFTIPLGGWGTLQLSDGLGLIYLAVIGTVVSHSLWVYSTTELPTTTTSIIKYLYIPLTAIVSFLTLGETLSPMQFAGSLVIILGSVLGVFGKYIRLSNSSPETP